MNAATGGAGFDTGQGAHDAVRVVDAVRAVDAVAEAFAPVATATIETLRSGGRVLLLGNGGSQATASGVAAAFVLAERWHRAPFPAVDLTADAALWSGAASGWGFDQAFLRGLEVSARAGDILLLFSPTGTPANLVEAARWAAGHGVQSVGFLAGEGGVLRDEVTFPVLVPTSDPFRAREAHLALGHALVEEAEAALLFPVHRELEEAVAAEIGRTSLYRALSAALLEAGDEAGWESVNELLADEQHHRARLAARLMELGVTPTSTGMQAIPPASAGAMFGNAAGDGRKDGRGGGPQIPADLTTWRDHVRGWEREEVVRYRALLEHRWMDRETRALVASILASEEHHFEALGGKWMSA